MEKDKLITIATFDFFNLHDHTALVGWLANHQEKINKPALLLNNLKQAIHRKQLYQQLLAEQPLEWTPISIANLGNLQAVVQKICSNYLQTSFSEAQLFDAIGFFYGNCGFDVLDELPDDMYKAFWKLVDLSSLKPHEFPTFRPEIIAACQTISQFPAY